MDYPKTTEFLNSVIEHPRFVREWIYETEKRRRAFAVYLRTSIRPFTSPTGSFACGYTLEIANVQTGNGDTDTGKGYFTKWLDAVLVKANERFNFVYVENVSSPRFGLFFVSRGWVAARVGGDYVPSYFRRLPNQDGVETDQSDGLSKAYSRLMAPA